MLLDISDAADKKIIWRGWARFDVTHAMDNQEELNKRLSNAVRDIVNKYHAG